ncbi:hypothetical protein LOK49_LG08G00812 [Camellia lanceoleosa]|uniref:Uncharacterized protein n=1 Tax=Camellia lanceoleosa TaxID=1840588 RepID=A0ACC0GW92_9ERIC|nr:hypothetical protein LOK49_LG08G00812 [Camellia lanceoleosa]
MNTDNTTSKKEGSANPNPDPNNPAGATDHPKTIPPSASRNPSSKPSKAAAMAEAKHLCPRTHELDQETRHPNRFDLLSGAIIVVYGLVLVLPTNHFPRHLLSR